MVRVDGAGIPGERIAALPPPPMSRITPPLLAFLAVLVSGTESVCAQPADAKAKAKVRDEQLALIEQTGPELQKWTEIQQLISKERRDWATAKEIFSERIQLAEAEVKGLDDKIAEAKSQIGKSDAEKEEAIQKRDANLAATAELRAAIIRLENRVRELHAAIPAPLQDKIAPLYTRMPPDQELTKVATAERFQNVIGILNEMNKINSDIAVVSEIRLIGERPTEVKSFYVGLGQGYYLSAKGDAAGRGWPTPKGWEWIRDDSLIKPLTESVAVLNAKAKPHFLPLPAKIQ